jgi:hypothetical protein
MQVANLEIGMGLSGVNSVLDGLNGINSAMF